MRSETGGTAPELRVMLGAPARLPPGAKGNATYTTAARYAFIAAVGGTGSVASTAITGVAAPAPGATAVGAAGASPRSPAGGRARPQSAGPVTVSPNKKISGGAVRVGLDGTVREPASGTFDVTVAPGENVQAAVDVCPPGGSVLLLPGNHDGPLVLVADKVVHVFGRGKATLRAAAGTVVKSEAVASTLDGHIIRREAGVTSTRFGSGVWISGGRLRLQACDITSAIYTACVWIEGGADPLLTACSCVSLLFLRLAGVGEEQRPVAG